MFFKTKTNYVQMLSSRSLSNITMSVVKNNDPSFLSRKRVRLTLRALEKRSRFTLRLSKPQNELQRLQIGLRRLQEDLRRLLFSLASFVLEVARCLNFGPDLKNLISFHKICESLLLMEFSSFATPCNEVLTRPHYCMKLGLILGYYVGCCKLIPRN
jgi:hypothetical protein